MDESPMSAANAGTNTRTMRMGISLPVWRTRKRIQSSGRPRSSSLGLTSEAIRVAPANAATTRLLDRGDHLAEPGHAAAVVWALEAQTPAVAAAMRPAPSWRARHTGLDRRFRSRLAVHHLPLRGAPDGLADPWVDRRGCGSQPDRRGGVALAGGRGGALGGLDAQRLPLQRAPGSAHRLVGRVLE